uniref:Cyclic nucleotide-binding domain-containing protein n=1 Tax=Odontella aurita TaxID=265563 RepID=A0A7S4MNS1_9STRA|mmetsp:Transcript_27016/g.79825  ORF Transcript_27016/g.79825 Transcript_27016/m.79825 type:complete len:263 (+) Transcript_27016:894-1682(+)
MEASEVKVIPKTEEEAERIGDILRKNVLFRHLDEEQKVKVKDAMFGVEKEENDVIIKQGEDGDNFFCIDSGSVDVYIESPGSEGGDGEDGDVERKLVASYGQGDSFGELAIMYNAPRAATCVAKGPVRMWALDRVSFKTILMQAAISKRNMHKNFLQNVPVLSQLTEYEILTIADALQEECFEDGAVVCNEGDGGEKFFMVKEGTAVCTQKGEDDTSREVARLGDGSYFGEVSCAKVLLLPNVVAIYCVHKPRPDWVEAPLP